MQITDYIEGFSITNVPKCMHLLPTGELVLKGVQLGDIRFTDEVEKYGLLISFLSEEDQSRYIELYFSGFSHMDYNSALRDSTKVIEILQPNAVVFTSKAAYKAYCNHKGEMAKQDSRIINTVHPCCSWWNRKHGNDHLTGRERLEQKLRECL